MNNTFFKKTDFTLCNVPVPHGYPQSQTHAGVFKVGDKVYLSASPFPLKIYSRFIFLCRVVLSKISRGRLLDLYTEEKYENPFVYYAQIKGDAPTCFVPMCSKPLMDTPEMYYGLPSYNSDPDLFIEDGTIHVLNRVNLRRENNERNLETVIRIYLITGVDDNGRFKMQNTALLKEYDKAANLVSPCLIKYEGYYYLFLLNTQSALDGKSFFGLSYLKASSVENLKGTEDWQNVKLIASNYLPWHMSVFIHNKKVYTVVACVEPGKPNRLIQRLGVLDLNSNTWGISDTPLTDVNSYRGAAYVDENGKFVLYSATLHEKIKGSRSVDGRDIIVASCEFGKLLAELKLS